MTALYVKIRDIFSDTCVNLLLYFQFMGPLYFPNYDVVVFNPGRETKILNI